MSDYQDESETEKRRAIASLRNLANQKGMHEIDARFFCVQWALELRDVDLARKCLPVSFVKRHPFSGNTLRGWSALESGDKPKALDSAVAALNSRLAHCGQGRDMEPWTASSSPRRV